MKTNNYDYGQNTINEMNDHVSEASHVLRANSVETKPGTHLSLNEAANSVSVPTDEMLAVMEYRLRHAAQHNKE